MNNNSAALLLQPSRILVGKGKARRKGNTAETRGPHNRVVSPHSSSPSSEIRPAASTMSADHSSSSRENNDNEDVNQAEELITAWPLSRPSDHMRSLRRSLLERLIDHHHHNRSDRDLVGSSRDIEVEDNDNKQQRGLMNESLRDFLSRSEDSQWIVARKAMKDCQRTRRACHRSNNSDDDGANIKDEIEGLLQWIHNKLDEDECSLSITLRAASQAEAGLTLMHVFISDLLGRITNRLSSRLFRQVLEQEFRTQCRLQESIKLWQRCFAVIFLIGANVFFGYYTLLRGLQQGTGWQKNFLLVLAIQWLSDTLFTQVMQIVILDCCLPLFIAAEMRQVWVVLDHLWLKLVSSGTDHSQGMNFARCLLVSQRCATCFSSSQAVFEAQLILSYHIVGMPVGLVDCCTLCPDERNSSSISSERQVPHKSLFKDYFLGLVLQTSYSMQSGVVGMMASLLLTAILFVATESTLSLILTCVAIAILLLTLVLYIVYMKRREVATVAPLLGGDRRQQQQQQKSEPGRQLVSVAPTAEDGRAMFLNVSVAAADVEKSSSSNNDDDNDDEEHGDNDISFQSHHLQSEEEGAD